MPRRSKKTQETFKLDGQFLTMEAEGLPITGMRQLDSTGVFGCPGCLKTWYVGDKLMKTLNDMASKGLIDAVHPRCKACDELLEIKQLPAGLPPPLTVESLKRIYFRAEDETGNGIDVNAYEATDQQFEQWITTRLSIVGEPDVWPLDERVAVCDTLWMAGMVRMINTENLQA